MPFGNRANRHLENLQSLLLVFPSDWLAVGSDATPRLWIWQPTEPSWSPNPLAPPPPLLLVYTTPTPLLLLPFPGFLLWEMGRVHTANWWPFSKLGLCLYFSPPPPLLSSLLHFCAFLSSLLSNVYLSVHFSILGWSSLWFSAILCQKNCCVRMISGPNSELCKLAFAESCLQIEELSWFWHYIPLPTS